MVLYKPVNITINTFKFREIIFDIVIYYHNCSDPFIIIKNFFYLKTCDCYAKSHISNMIFLPYFICKSLAL